MIREEKERRERSTKTKLSFLITLFLNSYKRHDLRHMWVNFMHKSCVAVQKEGEREREREREIKRERGIEFGDHKTDHER